MHERHSTGHSAPTRGSRAHLVAAVLVGIGAVALRLLHLDQPVRYDEAVTFLEYVRLPLAEAVATYDLPNNHVLHTVLAHLTVDLFGEAPRAFRLPALAAGVATVPAVYWVGRRLRGPDAGLVAAALAAASPVLVLFSTNARGYSTVVLAFLLLVGLLDRVAERPDVGAWAAAVVVMAAGAWTMPIMLYPAVAAAAWLVAESAWRGRRSADRVILEMLGAGAAAMVVTVLLYLPVFREEGVAAVVSNRFVAPRDPGEVWAGLPGFLEAVGGEWIRGVPVPAVGVLAAAGLLEAGARIRALIRRWLPGGRPGAGRTGEAMRPGAALLPVGLAASLVLLLATRRIPFPRVWLFLLPAGLLFVSGGLLRARDAVRHLLGTPGPGRARGASRDRGPGSPRPTVEAAVLAVGLLVAVGIPALEGGAVTRWGVTGALPHGDRVARFLSDRWDPGDAVRASIPSDAPLRYYFHRLDLPEDAVNGRAEPGACRYRVVNRRHGTGGGAPAAADGDGGGGLPLREWPGVAVYGTPAHGPAGGEASPCRD